MTTCTIFAFNPVMSNLQSDLRPIGRKFLPSDINSGRTEKVSFAEFLIHPK